MQHYLLLALAVILMALDNVLRKRFQLNAGTSLRAGLRFNVLLGGSAVVLFWGVGGFKMECTPYSLLMAFVQAALAVAYTVIGFGIMKKSIALYALFLMTGGMMVPYLCGVLFLGESFSWLHAGGLALILAAIVLSRAKGARTGRKLMLPCAAVFLLNGAASAITKLHQVPAGYDTVSSMGFVVLVNLGKLVLSSAALGVMALYRQGERVQPEGLRPRALLPVLACTAVSGTAYLLQLTAAKQVRATVMYPMITGGTILASALFAWLFYRERPTPRIWAGMLLCLAGTCMFL